MGTNASPRGRRRDPSSRQRARLSDPRADLDEPGRRDDDVSDLVGRRGVFRVARGSPESGLDVDGVDVESGEDLIGSKGYLTAWFRHTLEDDPLAGVAFAGTTPEPGWTDKWFAWGWNGET